MLENDTVATQQCRSWPRWSNRQACNTNWGGSSAADTTTMPECDHLRTSTWDSSGTYDPSDVEVEADAEVEAATLALIDSPRPRASAWSSRSVAARKAAQANDVRSPRVLTLWK
ncbi:hypothetical protein RQN9TF_32265 (plasmid) [Rhodococcus qingshengii]|nr:hypothetical protein RQN9TF_32265 [Rhodococcus qingshengii]